MKTVREYYDLVCNSDKKKYYFTGLVCIWALLFMILLFRGPLETDNLAYLQENKITHHTAVIDGFLEGDRVKINLDLTTLKSDKVDYAKLYGALVHAVKKASLLPLSREGFKVIVRSEVTEYLVRSGELNRGEFYKVDLGLH